MYKDNKYSFVMLKDILHQLKEMKIKSTRGVATVLSEIIF